MSFLANFFEVLYSKILKIYPLLILRIDLINRCNLRCKMCYYNDVLNKEPLKEFSFEQIKFLLKTSGRYLREIMLSCGFEPLMSKDFKKVVEYISENYPKIRIALCSNGLLMRKEISDLLIRCKVRRVEISLDGVTKKTYETIRRNSNFDLVVKNLKYLKQQKKKLNARYPKLQINFVIQKDNLHEASKMVSFAKSLGADSLVFRKVVKLNNSFEDLSLEGCKKEFNLERQKIIKAAKFFKMEVMVPSEFKLTRKKK